MNQEECKTAILLVESKNWRWMPGMLTLEGYRLDAVGSVRAEQDGDQLPDLTDPATVGCIANLVREAFGDEKVVYVVPPKFGEPWDCWVELKSHGEKKNPRKPGVESFGGATEALALASALLACGKSNVQ